ncbi:MAG: MucR family transcriptional regulator [Parvibaculum sp.]|nr:MucR family transcriptional regulator [Parvibaculum sp.]
MRGSAVTRRAEDRESPDTADLLVLTSMIVRAHVRNNWTSPEDLPPMIRAVHGALATLGAPSLCADLQPAVPIKKSVTPEYLICLEDGARLKTLTRYLQRRFGLTPEQYRAKWKLPVNYPMTAPNSARRYRQAARNNRAGRQRKSDPDSLRRHFEGRMTELDDAMRGAYDIG